MNVEIKFILGNYLKAFKENNQKALSAIYVRKNLKSSIINTKCININNYIVKGSTGAGNISEIPWLGIFDKEITTGAQKGYYIVYLFRADMKGVYLSFNQGWTKFKEKETSKDALNDIRIMADFIRNNINTNIKNFGEHFIDLNCKGILGKGYEAGNIFAKYYPINNLPSDDVFIYDLNEMVGIYREVKGLFPKNKYLITVDYIKSHKSIEDKLDLAANEKTNLDNFNYKEEIQKSDYAKTIDEPKLKEKCISANSKKNERNIHIAKEAINDANYKCECDNRHYTFINKYGQVYMEAHHLIPISYNDYFKYSLDVKANIICLCPNCHMKLHYGSMDEKKEIIKVLYDKRINRLKKCGINVSFEKLLNFYS